MKKNRQLNQKKRESILKAAIEEFYKRGYEGSSMSTISKEAKVSKATIYNHFKNKEELFLEIMYLLKNRYDKAFTYKFSNEKSIDRQLYEIAKQQVDFFSYKENMVLIQIATIVMIQKNKLGIRITNELIEDDISIISIWFIKAKETGYFNFDDPHFITRQYIGMIKSFTFYPQLYGSPILNKEEQEKVIQQAIEMIKTMYMKKA